MHLKNSKYLNEQNHTLHVHVYMYIHNYYLSTCQSHNLCSSHYPLCIFQSQQLVCLLYMHIVFVFNFQNTSRYNYSIHPMCSTLTLGGKSVEVQIWAGNCGVTVPGASRCNSVVVVYEQRTAIQHAYMYMYNI